MTPALVDILLHIRVKFLQSMNHGFFPIVLINDAIFEILPKTTAKRLKTYTSKNKMNEVDDRKQAVKLYLESESKRKKK